MNKSFLTSEQVEQYKLEHSDSINRLTKLKNEQVGNPIDEVVKVFNNQGFRTVVKHINVEAIRCCFQPQLVHLYHDDNRKFSTLFYITKL